MPQSFNAIVQPLALLCLCFGITSCTSDDDKTLPRNPGNQSNSAEYDCPDYMADRQPLFGDLHVHTGYSIDAAQAGAIADPYQAFRFGKGEPISTHIDGRVQKIDRPLDFAAVTDHSEFMAETQLCFNPEYQAYQDPYCTIVRGDSSMYGLAGALTPIPGFDQLHAGYKSLMFGLSSVVALYPLTTPGEAAFTNCIVWGAQCDELRSSTWEFNKAAVRSHYSPCEFTSLHAFEWTGSQNINGKHRNVIFGTDTPIELPVSYFDAPDEAQLWNALDNQCKADDGCQVLAIPHNSNMGGGYMFRPSTPVWSPVGQPYSEELAAQRARLEPLVEIMQEKGQSECVYGPGLPFGSVDEECKFELLAHVCTGSPDDPPYCQPRCSDSYQAGGGYSVACVEPSDFVRGALRSGLMEKDRIGINPFKLGFIGSTDTHLSTPGDVIERREVPDMTSQQLSARYIPPFYNNAPDPIPRLINFTTGERTNPGALAVVWAEQNSRGSIFAALKRKETYATSGPRITARLFGGWKLDENLCNSANFARSGYAQGVPMGSDLPKPVDNGAPRFAVSALMDTGPNENGGMPLQQIQIIKGWSKDGQSFEKVFNVAGDPDNGASVDTTTCETSGQGFAQLCEVWTDPEFDPEAQAFYYARVLENPQCRWSQYQCVEVFQREGLSCEDIADNDPLKNCCEAGATELTVQERAWTSPIWYEPDAS